MCSLGTGVDVTFGFAKLIILYDDSMRGASLDALVVGATLGL
jgi:hypothetical protein